MTQDPMLTAVADFHRRGGQPVGDSPAIRDQQLRLALIREEGAEAAEAMRAEDLSATISEIADTLYVVFGTAVAYGLEVASAARPLAGGTPGFPAGEGEKLAGEWEQKVAAVLAGVSGDDPLDGLPAMLELIRYGHELGARFGLPIDPFFAEIHRANLDKLDGPRRSDGKLLKPEGWQPAQIDRLLVEYGVEAEQVAG